MTSIIIRLKASELENPDLDIRYELPDRIASVSDGRLSDDGYDYGADSDELYLFLKASDPEDVKFAILVVENDIVCGNRLENSVVIAVRDESEIQIVFPKGYVGSFNMPGVS